MQGFTQKKYQVQEAELQKIYRQGEHGRSFDPSRENIYLIGPRGCGKTTLAQNLAQELNMQALDTDHVLQTQFGQSIADFVQSNSWAEFRRQEQAVLQEICTRKSQVVATGGGCVLEEENRRLISENGVVFYLMADASLLASRLEADPRAGQRPRFSSQALLQEMADTLQEREELYFQCLDYILQAQKSPAELVQDVLLTLGLEPEQRQEV